MALNKDEDYNTANTSDPVDLDFYIRELHSWEDWRWPFTSFMDPQYSR